MRLQPLLLPVLLAAAVLPLTTEAARAAPAADATMRCNGKLIHRGDRMFEVRQLCGEPDVVVPMHTVHTARYGLFPTREAWQYNRGPGRLIRVLIFRSGRLEQIQTGGYGLPAGDRTCSPAQLEVGITQVELQARCGEPRERDVRITRTRYRVDALGRAYPAGLPAEDWIYDLGPTRFLQVVTLINGRVVSVEPSRLRGGGRGR